MKKTMVVFFGFLLLFACQRDLSEFDYLLEPKISMKAAQKILVVEVKGDPNVAGKTGFGELFKTFFTIKKDYKDLKMSAPRARWLLSADVAMDEWIGLYALPLNVAIEQMPVSDKISPNARIEEWYGGEVAEILHIGAYEDETSTIEKLLAFIDEQGYDITSYHEEEYLRGPRMLLKGNPKNYRTIIRYEVSKRQAAEI